MDNRVLCCLFETYSYAQHRISLLAYKVNEQGHPTARKRQKRTFTRAVILKTYQPQDGLVVLSKPTGFFLNA